MCSTEHMSYAPYENLQTYRLPGATFPLRFTMHGTAWRLETLYVEGGGHWRCYLEGPKIWVICAGTNKESIERDLMEIGVEIPARTFPGTVFRYLVGAELAERL